MLSGISCYCSEDIDELEIEDCAYALKIEFEAKCFVLVTSGECTREEFAEELRGFADAIQFDIQGPIH